MSDSKEQPTNVNGASVHRVVLLLERLVIAVEKIAGTVPSREAETKPVNTLRLSDVEKHCRASARRWFKIMYEECPEVKYAEQVTDHHLERWSTIAPKNREHIRQKLREMLSQ